MKFKAAGKSHVGLVRDNNEDSYWIDEDKGIFIVCDGIGGEQAGEIASKTAIEVILSYFDSHKDSFKQCKNEAFSDKEIFNFFIEAARVASEAVYEKSISSKEFSNMGCTLTMAVLLKNKAVISYIGDSRAYLINSLGVHQVSEDHTLAKEYFAKGLIKSIDDAPNLKNILSRSIGSFPAVASDNVIISLEGNDRIVLCTDGVSNYFNSTEQIDDIISNLSVEDSAEALIDFALENKGQDNATAIVVDILEDNLITNPKFELDLKISELIRNNPVFDKISYIQIAKLRSYLSVLSLEPGEVLLEKLEKVKGFYLVIEGSVSASNQQFNAGDGIGLKALAGSHHSSSDKRADEKTIVAFLSNKMFDAFAQKHPKIAIRIYKNILKLLID